jgi:hypothetical protein
LNGVIKVKSPCNVKEKLAGAACAAFGDVIVGAAWQHADVLTHHHSLTRSLTTQHLLSSSMTLKEQACQFCTLLLM